MMKFGSNEPERIRICFNHERHDWKRPIRRPQSRIFRVTRKSEVSE